jgi:hypothetical protein
MRQVFSLGPDDQYSRVSECQINGPRARLVVTVWHVGQGPAGRPLAQAHQLYRTTEIFPEHGVNHYGYPVAGDLGDESAYQLVDDTQQHISLWYSARMGAFVVQVSYEVFEGIGIPAMRDAAHTALQEVLSRL